MEIVKYGHPVLRWKSRPFQELPEGLDRTIDEMFELMYASRGIGLAANQVGLPYRMFVVNCTADPAEADEELVFINPKITRKKGSADAEEGCLSLPELYGEVPRAKLVVVQAYDLDGEMFEIEAEDLLARVIQHENDHLDGVLFIDRMKPEAREDLTFRLRDFETAFRKLQQEGRFASDEQLKADLTRMERTFELPPPPEPSAGEEASLPDE